MSASGRVIGSINLDRKNGRYLQAQSISTTFTLRNMRGSRHSHIFGVRRSDGSHVLGQLDKQALAFVFR